MNSRMQEESRTVLREDGDDQCRAAFLSASRRGFTIIELMAAATILLIVVTLSLYGFMYALKENARAMVQNELDMDVQKSMEALKKDLRLSALDMMFFHPLGSGSYSAVSFPLAYDNDGDGAIDMGTNGRVVWDETVIFHVWKTSPNQLRRTRFRPRNNNLTDAQRQDQLTYVATNGSATNLMGGGTYDWSNAVTDVIFENLFDWSVQPQAAVYNAYSARTNRDQSVNLGSCIITNGPHEFKFIVVGKDAQSSGYKIGLDTLIASPAGTEREAELQPVTSVTAPMGVLPVSRLMLGGSWSHNRELYFPATATGQTFTLNLTNDCWEDVLFNGTGQKLVDTVTAWDDPYPSSAIWPPTTDYIVRLDCRLDDVGKQGWYALHQTQGGLVTNTAEYSGTPDPTDALSGCAVRVLIRGEDMEYGSFIPYNSMANYVWFYGGGVSPDQQLKIEKAYMSECATSNTISPDSLGSFHKLNFTGSSGGESVTLSSGTNSCIGYCVDGSDWWNKHRVDKKKSYFVTFLVSNEGNKGHGHYWTDTYDPAGRGCWIIPNGTEADLTTQNWSGNTNVIISKLLYSVGGLYQFTPSNGFFTSSILDTKKIGGVSNCVITWTNDLMADDSIRFKLRAGNDIGLTNAPVWSNVTAITVPGTSVNLGANRYIQYQAELRPVSWFTALSPKLHGVRISWQGDKTYVDVGGTFTKGPDYGVWELQVDGQRLVRGITVNLEIFEDIYSRQGPRRITSTLASEVTPRNTGK